MIPDLAQLLKKIVEGDDSATDTLFTHFTEQTIDISEQEQVHIYLKQISRTHYHAIYIRALLYEKGYGVKADLEMTFLLMREAAGKGHSKATYEVGRRFLEGIGVPQNYANALQWLQLAAESPHYIPQAMFYLGQMYEKGLGVDPDPEKAHFWYEKAAAKGYR